MKGEDLTDAYYGSSRGPSAPSLSTRRLSATVTTEGRQRQEDLLMWSPPEDVYQEIYATFQENAESESGDEPHPSLFMSIRPSPIDPAGYSTPMRRSAAGTSTEKRDRKCREKSVGYVYRHQDSTGFYYAPLSLKYRYRNL